MVSKFGWLVVVVFPCLAIIIYDVVKIFERMFKIKRGKDLLSHNNTKQQREDLNKTIVSSEVSKELQDKLDIVYDSIGIENNIDEIEELGNIKEEENVEVL